MKDHLKDFLRIGGVVSELVALLVAVALTWLVQVSPSFAADAAVLTANEERALKPGDKFRDCTNGCPLMVVIPSGKFMMGTREGLESQRPQHEVTISKPFAVGKYEVTFAEWDACVTEGGCPETEGLFGHDMGWGRGARPIINLSLDDAQQYVAWLSEHTGKSYRLLTEAEWEYAARGGTTTLFSWGDNEDAVDEYAWYAPNSHSKTHPVGEKKPNPFGLHDMHGNVWEWVEDCAHRNYIGAPQDGSAWTVGCERNWRIARGGAHDSKVTDYLRSGYRLWTHDIGNSSQGFRVARLIVNDR
jgi:formylglycine-generating enzyme required for sulfatase activity